MADGEEIEPPFGSPDVPWIKHSEALPETLFACGECEGKPVYAGRVLFDKEFLIGTVFADKKKCLFTANGSVHESSDYELLTFECSNPLKWNKVEKDGSIEEEDKLLISGKKKNGDLLYVGRLKDKNEIFIGWVDLEKKQLHVSKHGVEHVCTDFEILIHQFLDRICICPPCPPGYSPPRF